LGGRRIIKKKLDTYNSVQEICSHSIERYQSHFMARINDNQGTDPVEMAKIRNQTRTELAKVLSPEELEEFLLRYSHNANKLRQEMRGLDLSPEEFRRVFRA